MSSYNLIPVTDLTAVGFTGTVSTTAFTVNSATVNGDVRSNQFVTNVFPTTQPMFTFADDLGTGIFSRTIATTPTSTIGFSVQGTTVFEVRPRNASTFYFWLGNGGLSTNQGFLIQRSNAQITSFLSPTPIAAQANSFARIFVPAYLVANVGGISTVGLKAAAAQQGFIFDQAKPLTIVGSLVTDPNQVASIWASSETDGTNIWHFNKPGLLQQATTIITPSTTRSNAHINNLTSGITTVFVTLPTSVEGLKYTISNARAVANTVVVNPRAADTLTVFGLTKAAGASVTASAPFSSITFHCVTSTRWVATKQTGAWI